ncbi:Sulfite exporter TauE/SafE [Rubellimicrobium thermophilum DSM 16684]|uniref:Probable membrane transporter protein n=1 Tax=Rubellimicrobium thermophilum DSM 16684 TaxID=1123069 RepID=S9R1J7_9RHOB|nr:Sulfite exporter TauE/SafE [Rubellimicrobium thermophilum DSM 16684]
MLGFVTLRGHGLLRATAHTKLLNFASNVGAMAVFAAVAEPWWVAGLVMGVAQAAGAQIGARAAVRVGARLIRPLLVVTSVAMALRLLWQALQG